MGDDSDDPPEVQEQCSKAHPRIETARVMEIKVCGILLFSVVLSDGFRYAVVGADFSSTRCWECGRKRFHVKGMLFPGSLFALIIGLIVGAAVMWIR